VENDIKNQSVLLHINRLVQEEEWLSQQGELSGEDYGRLSGLKVELDRCWDLLRQRRALRQLREDPGKAKLRPARIVEIYEQQGASSLLFLGQREASQVASN